MTRNVVNVVIPLISVFLGYIKAYANKRSTQRWIRDVWYIVQMCILEEEEHPSTVQQVILRFEE